MADPIAPTKSETNSDLETNPTISISSRDSTFLQLTMKKLNGRNFRECAQSVKLVSDGKRKIGYLTGETKKLKATNSGVLQ